MLRAGENPCPSRRAVRQLADFNHGCAEASGKPIQRVCGRGAQSIRWRTINSLPWSRWQGLPIHGLPAAFPKPFCQPLERPMGLVPSKRGGSGAPFRRLHDWLALAWCLPLKHLECSRFLPQATLSAQSVSRTDGCTSLRKSDAAHNNEIDL